MSINQGFKKEDEQNTDNHQKYRLTGTCRRDSTMKTGYQHSMSVQPVVGNPGKMKPGHTQLPLSNGRGMEDERNGN